MWGLGAIATSPLVMLAERRGATAWLLYAIAVGALFTALILAGMNLEPETTEEEQQHGPARSENISTRSTVSLAALFFLYVGSENSVAGWVASLTKRTNPDSGDLWALTPMFFWGGLLAGRALVPLVPLRRRERALLASGLMLAAAGICLLLEARTFESAAICLTAAGLGLAGTYPILVAWLVKAFGERSRRIGAIMFALAGMGGYDAVARRTDVDNNGKLAGWSHSATGGMRVDVRTDSDDARADVFAQQASRKSSLY